MSYILLLFVHQLLPQTVPLWLKAMGGKLKSRSNEILEIKDQWDKHFAQQDADTNGRLLVLEQQNESADNSNFMWAEENRKARGDALAWSQQPFSFPRLILLRIVCEPLFVLMYDYLHMAGEAWDVQQFASAAQTGQRKYRLDELHQEQATGDFRARVSLLLSSPVMWRIIPQQYRTCEMTSLAMRMLSRSVAGVQMLLADSHRQFPYKLASALHGATDELFNTPLACETQSHTTSCPALNADIHRASPSTSCSPSGR